MKYKLNEKSDNNYTDLDNIKNKILFFRGINEYSKYIIPDNSAEYDYNLLDGINEAKACLIKHIQNKDSIGVIGDCDTDGVISMSMMVNYLTNAVNYNKVYYYIHRNKVHGITDIKDMEIDNKIKLLIIPDAGTNDVIECKKLKDKEIDIIILDHHDKEFGTKLNPYAIIVNNQTCDYPNKQLCGAAIVYKFLKCLDDELWLDESKKYLDIVALSLIADNMHISNLETRYYIYTGLNNIRNLQFKALIEKQSYSLKGNVTIEGISYYIAPLINAMVRFGNQSDKMLLYEGFMEKYSEFQYKPPGKNKEMIVENIYDRVARLCGNVKARQDKQRDEAILLLDKGIEKSNLLKKEKILFINYKHKFNSALTGVIAIKVAEKYNRPVLMLSKDKDGLFSGSARNTDKNCIKDFKKFLDDCKVCVWNRGHSNAFGSCIRNVPAAIEKTNEILKNVEFNQDLYIVDYIIDFSNLPDDFILQLSELKPLYGKGLEEPLIAIENVEIKLNEISVIGKKSNIFKFTLDGIEFIQFKCEENNKLLLAASEWIIDQSNMDNKISNKLYNLTIIGKCAKNTFNNVTTPQIEIVDFNINNSLTIN